jgi:(S)-2-hydroxyglutarate dehydrogenase
MKKYNVIIIGGGIVGLATAWQLLKQKPSLRVAVLEKESSLATHQTGHNSGVIHSGIYYKPGTLKAKNCLEGVNDLITFCNERSIPYVQCGKVIIASNQEELPRLMELKKRGLANGVQGLKLISEAELKEIEPFACGIKALYSPKTAIVDYVKVAHEYSKIFQELGGEIFLSQKVIKINSNRFPHIVEVECGVEYAADFVINCAGIQADRVAHMAHSNHRKNQILPFRGEYYELVKEKNHMIKGLIYPVPDPKFPFLGVHLSRKINGKIEAGPNAVLALSRNGYSKGQVNLRDCWDYITYKGFWMMAGRYWKVGAFELYRSYSKKIFLKALQKLVPSIQEKDLIIGGSGVRSQVVKIDGKMEDDFSIIEGSKSIHVLNAPSPAATASISIGKYLAKLTAEKIDVLI